MAYGDSATATQGDMGMDDNAFTDAAKFLIIHMHRYFPEGVLIFAARLKLLRPYLFPGVIYRDYDEKVHW